MANPLPTEAQIDAYLLDQLDGQADAAFEARIAAEPEVREAVLLRKMERAAVQPASAKCREPACSLPSHRHIVPFRIAKSR
ncbi:MAG: hypothetical protein AAF399_25250, partial [Bacteroidota bacterium]